MVLFRIFLDFPTEGPQEDALFSAQEGVLWVPARKRWLRLAHRDTMPRNEQHVMGQEAHNTLGLVARETLSFLDVVCQGRG